MPEPVSEDPRWPAEPEEIARAVQAVVEDGDRKTDRLARIIQAAIASAKQASRAVSVGGKKVSGAVRKSSEAASASRKQVSKRILQSSYSRNAKTYIFGSSSGPEAKFQDFDACVFAVFVVTFLIASILTWSTPNVSSVIAVTILVYYMFAHQTNEFVRTFSFCAIVLVLILDALAFKKRYCEGVTYFHVSEIILLCITVAIMVGSVVFAPNGWISAGASFPKSPWTRESRPSSKLFKDIPMDAEPVPLPSHRLGFMHWLWPRRRSDTDTDDALSRDGHLPA